VITCANCGKLLSDDERPCKACGANLRHVAVSIKETVRLSDKLTIIKERMEKNPKVLVAAIALTVGGALLGLIDPIIGLIGGLATGLASIWFGRNAYVKTRTIDSR
jgi:uncharacterized OB-fold protein